MNDKEPAVFRNVPRPGDSPEEKPPGGALLDRSSFEYLFEQVTGLDLGKNGMISLSSAGFGEKNRVISLCSSGFGKKRD